MGLCPCSTIQYLKEVPRLSDKKLLGFFTTLYGKEKAKKEIAKMDKLHKQFDELTQEIEREKVTGDVLFEFKPRDKNCEKCLLIFSEDKDLREYITSEFKNHEKDLEKRLENVRVWIKAWNNHISNIKTDG